jgi:hypothetical protein
MRPTRRRLDVDRSRFACVNLGPSQNAGGRGAVGLRSIGRFCLGDQVQKSCGTSGGQASPKTKTSGGMFCWPFATGSIVSIAARLAIDRDSQPAFYALPHPVVLTPRAQRIVGLRTDRPRYRLHFAVCAGNWRSGCSHRHLAFCDFRLRCCPNASDSPCSARSLPGGS